MKLVNLLGLMECPVGTIFTEYKPAIVEGGPMTLGSTHPDPNPKSCAFTAASLTDDIQHTLHNVGDESRLEHDVYYRDGPGFKGDELFLVWDKTDVEKLRNRLNRALEDTYK